MVTTIWQILFLHLDHNLTIVTSVCIMPKDRSDTWTFIGQMKICQGMKSGSDAREYAQAELFVRSKRIADWRSS